MRRSLEYKVEDFKGQLAAAAEEAKRQGSMLDRAETAIGMRDQRIARLEGQLDERNVKVKELGQDLQDVKDENAVLKDKVW